MSTAGRSPPVSRSLRGLLVAIAVGAAVGGALVGVAATVLDGPVAPSLGAGIGVAVGGGLGSAVWLFASDEAAEHDAHLDLDEAEPAAQPADLFEANPDPILFVGGGEPTVLAANPAFADVFGVDPDDLEGRPLAGSLSLERGTDSIVEAVAAGRPVEETVPCATADGPATARVRVIPTDGAYAAGYVVYGPFGVDD
jgi:PAS domain-containing protein